MGQENSLHKLIRDRIRTCGPMTFRSFMETALYEPGLGYYMRPETAIGKHGDFYTSPHAHPIFGAMVGRQIEECWEFMGRPSGFNVIEMGGGHGYLAMDILDYLSRRPIYPALAYTLIELNPEMERRQRALLEKHLSRVKWARGLDQLAGQSMRGIFISNELIDAFPVHLIEVAEGGPMEVYVTLDGEGFAESLGPLSDPRIAGYLARYASGLGPGYRTEVNLAAIDWISALGGVLSEGFILSIDYGYPASEYYAPERTMGTLMGFSKHRAGEDFYSEIGQADITAHVNFSAIRDAGLELGFMPIGYARQGPWLVSLGLDEVVTELYGETPDMGRELQQIQNLFMPGTMGDTHKVLVQYRGPGEPRLRGFGIRNETGKL